MITMLGWFITVEKGLSEAIEGLPRETRANLFLASWEINVHGLRWIRELEEAGLAILDTDRSNAGYPYRYSTTARHVFPVIANLTDQPGTNDWVKIKYCHEDRIARCSPHAILTVTAFDLS